MRFTTVFDNDAFAPGLVSGWGYSCLVGDDVLFDTGADGRTLLFNMERMGVKMGRIASVVLSHAHGDHTGGLGALLSTGIRPTVYVPRSFPRRFKADVRSLTRLVEVEGPMEIQPGIRSTGEMGRGIVEQALIVETEEGSVVVTGCAHPGIVNVVRRAREVVQGDLALVMGGFHLGGTGRGRIARIIADLRECGVLRVGPCHCTGDRAKQMFADAFGADFLSIGVGRVVPIGSEAVSVRSAEGRGGADADL